VKVLRVAAIAAALLVGVSASQAGFSIKMSDGSGSGSSSVTLVESSASGTTTGSGQGAYNYGSSTLLKTYDFDRGIAATSNTAGIRYGAGSDMSGVYFGMTSQLISTSSLGQIYSTSRSVIGNTTGSKQTVTIAISADMTTPGAIGTYLNLKQNVTVLNFYKSDGRVSTNTNNKVEAYANASPDSVYTPTLTFTGVPGGSSSEALFFQTASPYTLTQYFTITLDAGEYVSLQGDVDIEPLPAPPAIVLTALGIPALGLVRRWTRKTATEAVVA
jgi:hypothetical protein